MAVSNCRFLKPTHYVMLLSSVVRVFFTFYCCCCYCNYYYYCCYFFIYEVNVCDGSTAKIVIIFNDTTVSLLNVLENSSRAESLVTSLDHR